MNNDAGVNKIESLIDHHRWLLNNGVANDAIKNHLFMYGSIVHKNISAVDLSLDVENKTVFYKIYVTSKILKKINKFNLLRNKTSILDLLHFKFFLKREGNLDFSSILNSFIRDYCGKSWKAVVSVIDFKNYEEDYGEAEQLFN